MFGKVFSLIKYVIIAVFVIILASKLLDSVIVIALATQQGEYLSFILIGGITTVLLRIAAKNRKKEISSLLIQITAWCSAFFFGFVVGTTCILEFQHTSAMPAITLTAIGVTGIYCKIIYDTPDFRKAINLLYASARVVISTASMDVRGNGGPWRSINDDFRILLLPENSRLAILELLRDRPSLPVALTHLKDFDYITIPNDLFWQQRIDTILSKLDIDAWRASPLLEMSVQAFPLFHQSLSVESIKYGYSAKENVMEHLLKEWPVGMTVFPSTEGLKAVISTNRLPGLNLEHLSTTQALRLLIYRDTTAFPKGGIQDFSII